MREDLNDVIYTVALPGFSAKMVSCELVGAEFSVKASLHKGEEARDFRVTFPVSNAIDLALDPHVKLRDGQLTARFKKLPSRKMVPDAGPPEPAA